jgi:hypothetical protein
MKLQKKYSIDYQDYKSGLMLAWRHTSESKILKLLRLLLILSSSVLIFDNLFVGYSTFPIFLNAFSLLLGIIFMDPKVFVSFIASLHYRKQKSYLTDIELLLTADLITQTRKDERNESSWQSYSKFYYNDAVLALMKSPLLMTILPRRIFDDKEWKWLIGTAGLIQKAN